MKYGQVEVLKPHVMDYCTTSTPDKEAPSPDLEIDKQINDGNAIAGKRERIPTEGGRQETIRILKNRRTAALRESSKKRTKLTELLRDEENLHLVKSEFEELGLLFNNFQEAHEALNKHLTSDEDKDKEDDYFIAKQSAALEFRNQITHWIELAEARVAERADRLERGSTLSRSSRCSQHSRRSSRSAASARERERVKLAEMIAEKALLKEKQQIEELKLEIDIAKSRARERVYATIEAEESGRLASPLMWSTPFQGKGNSETFNILTEQAEVYDTEPIQQYGNRRPECHDAETEIKEHHNEEERITTEIPVATKDINEQQDLIGSKRRDATTDFNECRDTEGITTEIPVATKDINEQQDLIGSKRRDATTDFNECRDTEGITAEIQVAITDINEQRDLTGPKWRDTATEFNGHRDMEGIMKEVHVATRDLNERHEDIAHHSSRSERPDTEVDFNEKGKKMESSTAEHWDETTKKPTERTEDSDASREIKSNRPLTTLMYSTPLPNNSSFAEQALSNLLTTQLEQQREMLSSHQEMTAAMRLPQPKIPLFKGDVIEYKSFITAFDTRIKSRTPSQADLLYYLHQQLVGEPKDLVEGCLHLDPEEGYTEARRLLDKEYGDLYKVSVAYIHQIQSWPSVRYDDAAALKKLSLLLVKCKNAMKNISYMDVLNHTPHMQAIVQKLPAYLQSKWRDRVLSIRQNQRCVNFSDLVQFVEHAAETSNDPVYSREALCKLDERKKTLRSAEQTSKKPSPQGKGGTTRSLATSLASPKNSPDGAGSTQQQQKPVRCPLCEKQHDLEDCKDFTKKTLVERKKFVAEKHLCFACYGSNHRSKGCTNKRVCKTCSKPHPTSLHVENFNPKERSQPKDESKSGTTTIGSTCTGTKETESSLVTATQDIILHAILPVIVRTENGNTAQTYALYDNGSSGSFITEDLKEQLDVKGIDTTLQLGTMHGHSSVKSTIVQGLIVSDLRDNNHVELTRCYTRFEIPVNQQQIPTPEVVGKLENLRQIASDIPELVVGLEVGLLIGCDCPLALEPLEVVPSGRKGPFAMRLRHGWTVNGPLQLEPQNSGYCNSHRITVKEVESIKEVITPQSVLNMFELDFNDRSTNSDTCSISQEDKKFLQTASQSIQLINGHYELPLPFRNPNESLPNNRLQAVKRAEWQRRKMLRDEKYREDYIRFINDTISKGYAKKLPDDKLAARAGKVWYIPHHGVYHPRKPNKIRVVFDCSAKFEGISLNDTLLQGPNLTNSLVGVLTRFRQDPIAFMADIEAMFYQVRVPESQHDFLRFLWWPGGDLSADLQEYQMTVHLFGAVSSPSCASFALKRVCEDNKLEFGPQVLNTIDRNFYVDDCLRSTKDTTSAINLVKDVRQACARGGFRLTKFTSNDREVMQSIPREERSKETKSLDLEHESMPMEHALGVQWCVEADALKFRITTSDKPLTRRGVLSTVSSVYDPLGIVAPFVLVAKKLLQELCSDKTIGWDSEIPEEHLARWDRWRRELPLLEKLSVNRCVTPNGFGRVISQQVHVFSDASSTGYGAVAYLRQRSYEGRIHCAFLAGKARLAPIKTTTIPRLELTAATVSARMGRMLQTELDVNPSFKYHTDSTTVLRYIANQQTRFKVFVSNRIQTIRDLSEVNQWRYVATKENPADDASRGQDAKSLLENKRWLNGPQFLWKPEEEWPEQPFSMGSVPEDDPEIKATTVSRVTAVTQQSRAVDKLISHYSDWYRLKKAVAVFLRVRRILQSRKKEMTAVCTTGTSFPLSVRELQEAETAIIQYVQSYTYHHEIKILNQEYKELHVTEGRKKQLKKTSSIYRLDPYIDKGILRVGGRLNRAVISEESKHPPILPKSNHVTTLIIRDIHMKLGHAGRGHVLAMLRERFWVIKANSAVRQVISKCVTCRRSRGKPSEQKMADLPKDRVTPAPPFTHAGVDYFGPYVIKIGRKEVKRYGAIFTCLASRAVHIEIADSLETDSFIQALRRFIARRGPVKMIRSDNGTNFVGAQAELRRALEEMNQDQIKDRLRKEEIEWIFNPPGASHMGGVWERQIGTIRKVLAGLLNEHGNRLDDESLRTLMCEVEAVINSRPLTFVSSDANDLEPLTPSHLLTTKSSVVLPPPGDFQKGEVYMKRRWRAIQFLTNVFWKRWRREYLLTFQQRCKWQNPRRSLEVGDVVIIKDDSASRNSWPMGRVTAVEKDEQEMVRAAIVKTEKSELRRPANKLVVILAEEEQ